MQVEAVPDLRASYKKDRAVSNTPETMRPPECIDYVLWADIYQGCVCRRGNVYVQVEWGKWTKRTAAVPVSADATSMSVIWFEGLDLKITEPSDLDQLPLIIVNLMMESLVGMFYRMPHIIWWYGVLYGARIQLCGTVR